MTRGVSYFNVNVKGKGAKRLNQHFIFMTPENPNAPRLVKLRVLNNAYRNLHN